MADLTVLQIGSADWAKDVVIPEQLAWLQTDSRGLADFLDQLLEKKKQQVIEQLAEGEEVPPVSLHFSAVLITESLEEADLECLGKMIEAHTVFHTQDSFIFGQQDYGFCRRKVPYQLGHFDSRQDLVDYLALNLFDGQYGAKMKLPEIDPNPNFQGQVEYDGNVGVSFTGEFGQDFQPLFSFRYNLSSFPSALELWPEYTKSGNCEIAWEIAGISLGAVTEVAKTIRLREKDMATPYVLEKEAGIHFYAITVLARGKGCLKFGPLHWRKSRMGLGQFLLGGKRIVDEKRQELFYYFNPGDLKPPLTVYFSGFRQAEGFEGFFMMKRMKTPFMLIADPRLEGGCFYAGTEELETKLYKVIQDRLDYLGFTADQLVLSGLSMGSFGALTTAAHFNPRAVIVGKPFTNLGEMVSLLKLKRPDEFETGGDMIRNVTGGSDDEALKRFDAYFWERFSQSDFAQTQFAIAYMEQDDYDPHAIERIIETLAEKNAHIVSKGYEGRHNDQSRMINNWFIRQYHRILQEDFGREL